VGQGCRGEQEFFSMFFFLGLQRNHGTIGNAKREGRNIGVDAISEKKKKKFLKKKKKKK